MIQQYSIKGFPDLLVTSKQFSTLKTKDKRLLLLDRCNWFISSIVRENFKLDKPYDTYVNLYSQILKKYLGDRVYREIELCLIGLGIIIKNEKYSSGKFSKSFALTQKSIELGIVKTPVWSKKFNIKIKQLTERKFKDIYSTPVLKKILDNSVRLLVVEEPFHYVENIMPDQQYIETDSGLIDVSERIDQFKMDRYDAFYNSFFALNEITDPKVLFNSTIYYAPTISKSGRIYHSMASMPKLIRESLRTKSNDLIWEVDMCSAQPSIIFLEWLKSINRDEGRSIEKEYNLCLKLVLDGGIYSYIQDKSEYFKDLGYKKLKQSILAAINAEDKPTLPNKELSRLFPNVMKWINEIKQISGYKEVSFLAQSTEAKIFVEVYKKIPDDKFSIIIHDCILVVEEDIPLVKKLLEDRVRGIYGDVILKHHNLDKLFKTDLVSIPDHLLQKAQRDRFNEEFYGDMINDFGE